MSKPKLTPKERAGGKNCLLCNKEINTKCHGYTDFKQHGWENLKQLAAKWASKKIELENENHTFKNVHSKNADYEQAFGSAHKKNLKKKDLNHCIFRFHHLLDSFPNEEIGGNTVEEASTQSSVDSPSPPHAPILRSTTASKKTCFVCKI